MCWFHLYTYHLDIVHTFGSKRLFHLKTSLPIMMNHFVWCTRLYTRTSSLCLPEMKTVILIHSQIFQPNFRTIKKLQSKWPLSIVKLSVSTLFDSNGEKLDMFTFSLIFCTVIKYLPADPWCKFSNSLSNEYVNYFPSKT